MTVGVYACKCVCVCVCWGCTYTQTRVTLFSWVIYLAIKVCRINDELKHCPKGHGVATQREQRSCLCFLTHKSVLDLHSHVSFRYRSWPGTDQKCKLKVEIITKTNPTKWQLTAWQRERRQKADLSPLEYRLLEPDGLRARPFTLYCPLGHDVIWHSMKLVNVHSRHWIIKSLNYVL